MDTEKLSTNLKYNQKEEMASTIYSGRHSLPELNTNVININIKMI